ncbi:MAG: nucleoside hydrolase [Candidatus Omnitrophica bacterium]|nr:nucleoside hydrolase [Candidatus Omnitrophota bacterium]
MIHHTDLYHPHNDPDDHWDLASLYGLMARGDIDLKGVVIDHPSNGARGSGAPTWGDPALFAVGQLNHLSGRSVPVAVGSSQPFEATREYSRTGLGVGGGALEFLLRALEMSPEPVALTITGSCRDVATAGKVAPEIFRSKCRGIYLNAGTGTTDPTRGANQEWNVLLAPDAYRAIFDIPCPIYWLPCFETNEFRVATHGSYWTFSQGEILPELPSPLQNFFLYALSRSEDPKWLQVLERAPDATLLRSFGEQRRGMWCTAAFLHMARLSCDLEGNLLHSGSASSAREVFRFDPIRLVLDNAGVQQWTPASEPSDRFILRVLDADRYAAAMTRALKTLLLGIGPSRGEGK